MSAPEPDLAAQVEALHYRLGNIETAHFTHHIQLTRVMPEVERHAHMYDALERRLSEFEEHFGELSLIAAEQGNAMAAALAQRDLVDPDDDREPEQGGHEDRSMEVDLDTLRAWVAEHIDPLVRKVSTTGEGGGIRWCRQWWRHHDAVHRFTALYLAYDELSGEDSRLWLSAYLRDHLDPHLSTLTSPYGPFYSCTPRRHSDVADSLGGAPTNPDPGAANADHTATGGTEAPRTGESMSFGGGHG